MTRPNVLLTDYAWPDLEIETDILSKVPANLLVAESTDEETLAGLARRADSIMTTWANVPRSVIEAAPDLKIVSRIGIGLDNIDVATCTRLGVPVTNVPEYCSCEVAEHALALLLACGRKVAHYHMQTKAGRYELQSGAELRRIEGQTLGIVGLGNIGRALAEKAAALGLRVLATRRNSSQTPPAVTLTDLDTLCADSDYISLHAPLNDETRHVINAHRLSQMKPTAYLINTARGGLVDHGALAKALEENRLAGAALDVQTPEPPDLDQAPYNDPRVIVTPHAAFASRESLTRLRTQATNQVADRLQGRTPSNIVNADWIKNQRA